MSNKGKPYIRKHNPQVCKLADCFTEIGTHGRQGYCSVHYQRYKAHESFEPLRIHDGRTSHSLYSKYAHMIWRTSEKAPDKDRIVYFDRGITVCQRWLGLNGFWNFVEDMGLPESNNLTIERVDNEKGYEPSNCIWATLHQQTANRRNSNSVVGVSKANGRNGREVWVAGLMVDRVWVLKKEFVNYKDAVKARKDAEVKYLGGELVYGR